MKKDRPVQKRKHRWKRGILLFFCTALSVIFLGVSFGGLCLYGYIERHPEKFTADLSLFSDFSVGNAAAFYYFPKNAVGEREDPRPDLSGAVLLEDAQIGGGRTHYVPITEIPTDLQNAFVAIEDKRFYTHSGVDLRRTAAAVLSYLKKGSGGFGGSTITQQLVKNVTGENARTPMRKLSEILRAIDLERYFEKSEILERYLNVVPLANGIVGVGKAAERYYGKSASELTLAECASIAAITQNPSRYDPVAHPEENKVRRDCILSEMLAQGYIKEDAYLAAVASPVVTVAPDREEKRVNSWYTDLVIADVIEDLTAAYGYTRAEASRLVYYGNLRIYTFVDPELQRVVEEYYQKEENFPRLANGNAPASAMIVLDPETGNILAVAGAIGEKTADRVYNFATDAKRPPGSVLKPATVYAPALQRGIIHYASVYDDVPVRFTEGRDGTFRAWPHNASGVYRGLSNIDVAVRNSLNTVAVRVLEDLGIDAAFSFARDVLGIASLVENENGKSDKGLAALALGQTHYGVTLREMTAAYTAFANGGVYRNARSYAVVCDGDGNVLLENEGVMRPALSESTAELMTKLLENVTKNGTARALTLTDTTAVAGKTGTTQNTFDRWFIGYTPKLLAGVWYGCEYPESLESVSGNPSLSIWDGVMRELYRTSALQTGGRDKFSYPHLRAVRVCADSGKLIADACTHDPRGDRSVVAYFTEDQIPKTFCDCHVAVPYSGTGTDPSDGVAIGREGEFGIRTVGLLRVSRMFPTEIYVSDAQYTAAPQGLVPVTETPASDASRRPYYAEWLPEGAYVGRSYTALPFHRPTTKKKQSD